VSEEVRDPLFVLLCATSTRGESCVLDQLVSRRPRRRVEFLSPVASGCRCSGCVSSVWDKIKVQDTGICKSS
jgi:hypothetical protein